MSEEDVIKRIENNKGIPLTINSLKAGFQKLGVSIMTEIIDFKKRG